MKATLHTLVLLVVLLCGTAQAQNSQVYIYPTPFDSVSQYDARAILWKVEVTPPTDLPGKMKEGTWQQMYKDYPEKVRYKWTMKDGEKQGHWRAYYVNDSLEAEGFFINGMADSTVTYYYQDGGIAQQAAYVEDVQNGASRTWYEAGNIHTEAFYVSGVKVGPERTYFESGNLREMRINVDNQANGACFGFYESGELEYTGWFVDGKKDSTYTYYYKNGEKKAENSWEKDQKVGTWIVWREDGVIFSETKHPIEEDKQ